MNHAACPVRPGRFGLGSSIGALARSPPRACSCQSARAALCSGESETPSGRALEEWSRSSLFLAITTTTYNLCIFGHRTFVWGLLCRTRQMGQNTAVRDSVRSKALANVKCAASYAGWARATTQLASLGGRGSHMRTSGLISSRRRMAVHPSDLSSHSIPDTRLRLLPR